MLFKKVDIMTLILNIIIIISGAACITGIMLMSPKWWLGFGVGWVNATNEYGSKKSLEHQIKKVVYIAWGVFLLAVLLYPYLNG